MTSRHRHDVISERKSDGFWFDDTPSSHPPTTQHPHTSSDVELSLAPLPFLTLDLPPVLFFFHLVACIGLLPARFGFLGDSRSTIVRS
jgi:hypothetical protein